MSRNFNISYLQIYSMLSELWIRICMINFVARYIHMQICNKLFVVRYITP
jgi:hypothetical protein